MFSKAEIDQATFLGAGANRYCVISPRDTSICLKIDLPAEQKKAKNWRQYLQRALAAKFHYFNENCIEWRANQKLHRLVRQQEAVKYIAQVYSLDHSDLGWILSTELVRNEDGSVAKSLYHYIQQRSALNTNAVLNAIDEFSQFLQQYNIPLFDLNSGNLVVKHTAQGLTLCCIDIKSIARGKEILPLSYWSVRLMKKKIKRRADRLKALIQQQGWN